MPAELNLSQNSLPSDQASRQLMLHRYFQRQDIKLSEISSGWNLKTAWTHNSAYYIDDHLDIGLGSWPQPALAVKDIPMAVKQDQGFLLALNDCWSLLSWSALLADPDIDFKRINLIHLDSHTDLNSPRISLHGEDQWVDILTGQAFSVREPLSVVSAIKSSAIGIGSFICPLIASGIDVNLYHLSDKSQFRYEPGEYSLDLELSKNDPIFDSAIRPSLLVGQSTSTSTYALSDNLAELCASVDERYPTLLHIDLDYFNNRFDGRPDWRDCVSKHDPSIGEVLNSIDMVFDELCNRTFSIMDVSVGVSPGFFPAPLWQPAIEHLRKRVSTLWS